MGARGRKAIINRINRKLAPEGKAVVKTQAKVTPVTGREYHLLDSQQGTKSYLSLNEIWNLARKLGLLVIGDRPVPIGQNESLALAPSSLDGPS
jgi:hypothetical protein